MSGIAESVVLVTGATDGLGRRVAAELADHGATVLVHGRDDERGKATIEDIVRRTGNTRVDWYRADLASLREVRDLAVRIEAEHERLDVLVNNAAIGPMAEDGRRMESADGHELLFAVNYLAPFLLTRLLVPFLVRSAPSRVVNVASMGQAELEFDDLMLAGTWDNIRSYRRSKLAEIMFSFDLARELQGTGVTVTCLHPGTHMATKSVPASIQVPGSLEQGVAATVRLVETQELDAVHGRYFHGVEESRPLEQAYDPVAREALRRVSDDLVRQWMR